MVQIYKQETIKKRGAGVLLPVASLPSPYGIGTFGRAAFQWIDFLQASNQTYWQVLPLGPTGFGDSPYQSFSAFAGNPYFVDLELLCDEGLLTLSECESVKWSNNDYRIEYKTIFDNRENLLRLAFSRFFDKQALIDFRVENIKWIEDYALYTAVKTKMNLLPWTEWDKDIRLREPMALDRWRIQLREDIEYHVFVQYMFHKQWHSLKSYANSKGIYIIGDIPIYVAMDSSDAWANSDLFYLDDNKNPIDVSGCPPDGFSSDGQLWGNPLYRWDVLKQDDYSWWMDRLSSNLSLYDVLRIDHFRGFASYYAIPYGNINAVKGEWRKGPGIDFISAVNRTFGDNGRIIAEDLGYITEDVRELLQNSGYIGMKVLEFAFDSREESDYMPHNYPNNCVVYTGTHDNDTVVGWFNSANKDDISLAMEYFGIEETANGNWAFIRGALASVANIAIIPIQDYLGLGSEARINIPSTLGGNNWCWRMDKNAITPELAKRISRMTRLYGR